MGYRWLAVLLGLFLLAGQAAATGLHLSERDCADILERWGTDPASISPHLVDTCRNMMAGVAPAAGDAGTARAAATDPCADPAAADNVNCWGSWARLAPAAGGDFVPVVVAALRPELRPENADALTPKLDDQGGGEELPVEPPVEPPPPELPLGACEPGTPCGFATIVAGTNGHDDADNTAIVPFDMADDGSRFTVDPDGEREVVSTPDMEIRSLIAKGVENIQAAGMTSEQFSLLQARVFRGDDTRIEKAADHWRNVDLVNEDAESGFFAWGKTTPQGDLDTLNNGGAGKAVTFAGPMSVDNRTNATITVQFGADPSWTGNWTNPAYSFDAGGRVTGADLMSDPAQFSSNVKDGYVQGALMGPAGNQAIAHAVDVELDGVGRVRDVGLLPQVPAPGPF